MLKSEGHDDVPLRKKKRKPTKYHIDTSCAIVWLKKEKSKICEEGWVGLFSLCVTVTNLLPLSYKFILYYLICKNGAGPLKFFFTCYLAWCYVLSAKDAEKTWKEVAVVSDSAVLPYQAPSVRNLSTTCRGPVCSGVPPVRHLPSTAVPGTKKSGFSGILECGLLASPTTLYQPYSGSQERKMFNANC